MKYWAAVFRSRNILSSFSYWWCIKHFVFCHVQLKPGLYTWFHWWRDNNNVVSALSSFCFASLVIIQYQSEVVFGPVYELCLLPFLSSKRFNCFRGGEQWQSCVYRTMMFCYDRLTVFLKSFLFFCPFIPFLAIKRKGVSWPTHFCLQ